MLENLINLIKEQAGESVVNNPAIPNEQNEAVIASASQSIGGGLQSLISSGNLQQLLNLFHNNPGALNDHPEVQNITGNFIQQLMSKFGLGQAAAQGVAGSLIPGVLKQLASKTNDPADQSFSLEGIMAQFGGGKGLEGILGNGGQEQNAGSVTEKIKSLFA